MVLLHCSLGLFKALKLSLWVSLSDLLASLITVHVVSCKLTVQISLSSPPSISFRFLIRRLRLPSASSSSDGFTELSSIHMRSYTGWSNSRLLFTISATCWRTPFHRLMTKVYDLKNYYVTRKGSRSTSAQSSLTEIYGVRYSLLLTLDNVLE